MRRRTNLYPAKPALTDEDCQYYDAVGNRLIL
uniref:Uncharacterized protein n=1 Tax=Podoviridae sp. ct9P15 TaxID=2826543 RepID=A0A8S5MFI3_9CAUD|nr:MAG TPA: hypothetical protein [Podoviridae sp. ct9P15]